jgi:L-asparaginase II
MTDVMPKPGGVDRPTDIEPAPVLAPVLAEIWRGGMLECVHRGTAVVCRPDGAVVAAWGDPRRVILPRSSCKMIQALPLVESGAADAAGLTERHLALACASHSGAHVHTDLAARWLAGLGLGESDLRCGPQVPEDEPARHALWSGHREPGQIHNNCSGKHSGMLTLSRHLGGGAEYVDPEHPVQRAIRGATAETAREEVTRFAVDGCSAPNFAVSLAGLATAMAGYAQPGGAFAGARAAAAARLRDAMIAHPVLVAGEGRYCTRMMLALGGRAAVKSGAEGVLVAILPELGLGIALKVDDGAGRGAQAAMTALLARTGVLDQAHPLHAAYADAPLLNRRGIDCGRVRAAPALYG